MGACPKCGAKWTSSGYPYGDSWECESRTICDRDEFSQSDRCRIRELTQAVEKLQAGLVNQLAVEVAAWRRAYCWAYRLSHAVGPLHPPVSAEEMRQRMRAQAGEDLTDPEREVEQWEREQKLER
jgi:hypothetical protein